MGAQKKLNPLRVVLDTNAVVSALLFGGGRMGWLVDAWRARVFIPLASTETVSEILRVLAYPKFRLSVSEREAVAGAYLPCVKTIQVPGVECPVRCRDSNDLKFFMLATAAKADFLVSGDDDIHTATGFSSYPVLRPDDFKKIIFER